jgi:hypothetical protein
LGNWPTWAGFEKQLNEKKKFEHREILVERLKKQYGELLKDSPAVAANIELLLDQILIPSRRASAQYFYGLCILF